MFAVEMYFDAAGVRRVRELSNLLREHDVPSGPSENSKPHISLAVFREVNVERLSETIEEFARESPVIEVRLASIGAFPTDEEIIYVAPVVTRQLLDLHSRFHVLPAVVDGDRWGYCLPGKWIPHCSIVQGSTPAGVSSAVELSRGNDAFDTVALREIGLVEHGPYREVCVFPVGGGSQEALP